MTLKVNDVSTYLRNPNRVQRDILEAIRSSGSDDVYFGNASLPIVNALEAPVVTTAALSDEITLAMRSMFPSLSVTWEDLYCHLSDKDYLNLYAIPAKTDSRGIQVSLSVPEILAKSVTTDNPDIRQLIIPKHTRITMGDLVFTLEYPIVIKINPQGGITTIYDTSVLSDVQTLSSNQVQSSVVQYEMDGNFNFYLDMILVLQQHVVDVMYIDTDTSSNLTASMTFKDNFYYCESYMSADGKNWTRMPVTHSQTVMNLSTPTVVVSVVDNTLTAKIPRVYYNNGSLQGRVKILVYTTQGVMSKDLSEYPDVNSGMTVGGRDYVPTRYTAPVETLTDSFIISTARVEGGRAPLSFNDVKELIHDRSIDRNNKPITSAQISVAMANKGYRITPYIDTLTYRVFLATRDLPAPTGLRFTSPINSRLCQYNFTMEELSEHPAVYANSRRLTIKPEAKFELIDDHVRLMDPAELAEYQQDMSDTTLSRLSDRDLLQPVFHYVVDSTDNLFDCRAYHLSTPELNKRQFIGLNENLGLTVQVSSIDIAHNDDGYVVLIGVYADTIVSHFGPEQNLHAQISFIPFRSNNRARMNGVYVGDIDGVKMYRFDLLSTMDIDRGDNIYLNGFVLEGSDAVDLACGLTHDFAISFSVSGYDMDVDPYVEELYQYHSDELLSEASYVVSAEGFNITLGKRVSNFWDGAESYEGESMFARHQSDKIKYYSKDVYAYDEYGLIITSVDDEGNPVYEKLHSAGEPVLDELGESVYEWRVGDIVRDSQGDPVISQPAKIERSVDLFLVDARFSYLTDPLTIPYLTSIPERIIEWSDQDLGDIQDNLIQNSRLMFQPTDTMGTVNVTIDNDVSRTISSEQSLTVRFYLEGSSASDIELHEFLRTITTTVVNEHVGRDVISRSAIADGIRDLVGDDVVSIRVSGLGGAADCDVITVEETSKRCSLAKRMTRLSNGIITMRDDITIEFIKHRG